MHRRKIGDRRDDRRLDAAFALEPAEHLGDVRVDGDDHVGRDPVDQLEESAPSGARDQPLRELARQRVDGEHPEPDVPDPLEAVEDEPRRVLAHRPHGPPHRGEAVLHHDLDAVAVLVAQLRGERLRGPVVALADARAQDEHARHV